MRGVYLLLICVKKQISAKISKVGKIKFKKGKYVYIGSAQNGIEQRVKRHLRKRKKKFWHIDYLLANKNVEIEKVFYRLAGKKEECRLAKRMLKTKSFPVMNFGSSDCNCKTHLFFVENFQNKYNMKELVTK